MIRDTNKVVQRAVLQSPRLTDQEVEASLSMSSLTDEILRLIANNRNFRKNYVVVRNLLNNAKTPLDVSLHMLPMLNPDRPQALDDQQEHSRNSAHHRDQIAKTTRRSEKVIRDENQPAQKPIA